MRWIFRKAKPSPHRAKADFITIAELVRLHAVAIDERACLRGKVTEKKFTGVGGHNLRMGRGDRGILDDDVVVGAGSEGDDAVHGTTISRPSSKGNTRMAIA